MDMTDEQLINRATMLLSYMDERAAHTELVSAGVDEEDAFLAVRAAGIIDRRRELESNMSGPGKFEGEPLYVEAFWEEFLNGGADDDGPDNEVVFFLTPDDWRQWPALDGVEVLVLWENNDGFVGHDTMYRAQYERLLEQAHADASMGGDADDQYQENRSRSGTAWKWFAKKYALTREEAEAVLDAEERDPSLIRSLNDWRSQVGFPADSSPLTRGMLLSMAGAPQRPEGHPSPSPFRNNGTAIDRFAPHPPEKDWRVLLVEDYGPSAAYGRGFRFRVEGENLNYLPEDIDYKFSWRVRDLDDPRYDFSHAELVKHEGPQASWVESAVGGWDEGPPSHYRRNARRFGALPAAPRFSVGEHVEVVRGAFRGLRGKVVHTAAGPRRDLPSVILDHPVQKLLGPVPFSPSEIRRAR